MVSVVPRRWVLLSGVTLFAILVAGPIRVVSSDVVLLSVDVVGFAVAGRARVVAYQVLVVVVALVAS